MRPRDQRLGLGIGWRPELALAIDRRHDLGFVEVLAENLEPGESLPDPVVHLRERGVELILHSVSLSLGGADPVEERRLDRLAKLAEHSGALFVSDHIAFVRAGELEAGHLLPVPRNREAIDLVVANARAAQAALPVPLVLENIATLFEWPDAEMDEASFLTEVLEQADVGLLLDLENVWANALNHGFDPLDFLDRIPLERLVYVHVAGGVDRDGLYHDSHTHAVPQGVLELLTELSARVELPGVMLERDDHFPSATELGLELDAIAAAVARGGERRPQAP